MDEGVIKNGWIPVSDESRWPEEWEFVLGYHLNAIRNYALCQRYTIASGQVLWTWNGSSGFGVTQPQYWQPLPGGPFNSQRRRRSTK